MTAFLGVRDVVLKALEEARAAKAIGHPLAAAVTVRVQAGTDAERAVRAFESALPELFVVSRVRVDAVPALGVDAPAVAEVAAIDGPRCARCWNFAESVGADARHDDLCARCADVLETLPA